MIALSDRERILLRILLVIIGVFLIYFLIIAPLWRLRKESRQSWDQNATRLAELDTLYNEYKDIQDKKSKINELMRDTRGVSTLIEEYAKNAGILQNKAYNRDATTNMQNKYQKISTEVRFEAVDIRPVMKFLYDMEHSEKYVRISYLRVNQAFKERQTYDVTVKFESYQLQ